MLTVRAEGQGPWRDGDRFWTSHFNFIEEVRSQFTLPSKAEIMDCTLRDGEQTPGVVFRAAEKIELAKRLDAMGVSRIEVGMPVVSSEDAEATRAIVDLGLKAKIKVLCRAMRKDIEIAAQCGVWGVGIEVPIGAPRLNYQFNWTVDEVVKRAVEAIGVSKSLGLYTTIMPYDTTRADVDVLKRLLETIMSQAAPDSITVVDTNGCAIPPAYAWLVRWVREFSGLPVEVHTHNDLGLATANILAGIWAGASVAHVCVNGLGERAGNAPLEEVCPAIESLLGVDTGLDMSQLHEVSKVVTQMSGYGTAPNKAIVGELCFTRETGAGIDMLQKFPLAIFAVSPAYVGRRPEMALGKKSGKLAIRVKMETLGIDATDDQVTKIADAVKNLSIQLKRRITDEEFGSIVSNVLG